MAIGTSGVGSTAEAEAEPPAMPVRAFGRSGTTVPILCLGGSLNFIDRQTLLRQALTMGVSYWDTADNYSGGRSEEGIGLYFERFPADRKQVFLVSKTSSSEPERMDADLTASLNRLKTDRLDLYLVHGLSEVDGRLSPGTRQWVERAKGDGRIRYFGFSTHRNMADCLLKAARLGWVDGIMTTYNYRLMTDADMSAAVDACVDAGIGLIAMKTQGRSFSFSSSDRGNELVGRFMGQGMTEHQARLKAVWEDSRFAGICSHMDSIALLKSNAAAAVDGISLSREDRRSFDRHARQTASDYCTGCGHICEEEWGGRIPVADLMRCLLYAHCYNDYQMASEAYGRLPPGLPRILKDTDFSNAESKCPRKLAIGRLMAQARDDIERGRG
jgi:hypothetical protein